MKKDKNKISKRKTRKIPKYLKKTKNNHIKQSIELYIRGWYDLAILNLAIKLERKLRVIQFELNENITKKKKHETLNRTSLFNLIKWANKKKVFSIKNYEKALKLAAKRDYIAHSLHPRTRFMLEENKESEEYLIPINPGVELFIDKKSIKSKVTITFCSEKKEFSIDYDSIFENNCLTSIKDYYHITNEITKFTKKNKINIL